MAEPRPAIECYHVDCRLSRDLEDVGQARLGKVPLLLKYCLEALWCRFRHGAVNLYYVPARPARAPVYRDWLVLALCRPFFKRLIFHWLAGGLAGWLETEAKPWERFLTRLLIYKPDLSIVLRPFNRVDGAKLQSKCTEVVFNGIPDPCPQFEAVVRPRRKARAAVRKKLLAGEPLSGADLVGAGDDPKTFRVLFLSMCYSEKGLFDTVEAVAMANQKLADTPFRVTLTVAGNFWVEAERKEFEDRIRQPDLVLNEPLVQYQGFVSVESKLRLLIESDCLCFPTCMAEGFPLVLAESLAFGLPPILTKWRDLPEILPAGWPATVDLHAPGQIASRLLELLKRDYDDSLRGHFLQHYTDAQFADRFKSVLLSLSAVTSRKGLEQPSCITRLGTKKE